MGVDPEIKPLDDVKCTLVETWDEAQELLAWLGGRRQFLGIDLETEGTNVGRDRIRLAQLGDAKHCWAMDYGNWKGLLKTVVERYDRPYIAHNLLFESRFMKRDGIQLPQHLSHDSMVMAHLWDPRYAISLEARASRHIDKRAFAGKKALSEAFAGGKWGWATIPTDHPAYWVYGALDATLGALIGEDLWPKIQPWRKVYDVELGCIHVLRDAGLAGLKIDLPYVDMQIEKLSTELAGLVGRIAVDPKKDKDVIEWLQSQGVRDGWPWQEWPRTEKGEFSVDDDALKALEPYENLTGFVEPLRKWRKKERLLNSYFKNFDEMNVNGVLYPSVKPLGARTGRMSVTEPALQTLPKGSIVRNAFVSREEQTLILADYEGVELRVMASLAHEEALIEAFKSGADQHRWVASQAYEVPEDGVSDVQRDIAKRTQYARIYGAGAAKIAVTAGVPQAAIEEFLAKYDALFPGISRFMHDSTQAVRDRSFHGDDKTGYVDTVLGRRLPVEKDKAFKGVNYECQAGATADVLKLKLIELSNAGLGKFIRLPVHDEVVMEVPDDELADAEATVWDVMPELNLFDCPLTVDVESTKRWGTKYAGFD
jgi:DNA polymerase-1